MIPRKKDKPPSGKWTRLECSPSDVPKYVKGSSGSLPVEKTAVGAVKAVKTLTPGQQRAQWTREWKKWAKVNLAERCESCGTTYNLTPMHALKKRYILTKEDSDRCALICQPEHHFWEYGDKDNKGTHARMAKFVDGIIKERN